MYSSYKDCIPQMQITDQSYKYLRCYVEHCILVHVCCMIVTLYTSIRLVTMIQFVVVALFKHQRRIIFVMLPAIALAMLLLYFYVFATAGASRGGVWRGVTTEREDLAMLHTEKLKLVVNTVNYTSIYHEVTPGYGTTVMNSSNTSVAGDSKRLKEQYSAGVAVDDAGTAAKSNGSDTNKPIIRNNTLGDMAAVLVVNSSRAIGKTANYTVAETLSTPGTAVHYHYHLEQSATDSSVVKLLPRSLPLRVCMEGHGQSTVALSQCPPHSLTLRSQISTTGTQARSVPPGNLLHRYKTAGFNDIGQGESRRASDTDMKFRPLSSFKSPWHSGVEGDTLEAAPWIREIKLFLSAAKPGTPITLVSAEYNFRHALMNWLVAALVRCKPPVDNVLILTYDHRMWAFLYPMRLPCIYVPLESIVKDKMYWNVGSPGMRHLLIVRVTVMRLLNYWGYDVANYDADAIVLRNPVAIHKLYPGSDLIGQYGGSLPHALQCRWGAVMCMGAVILMRSTAAVGKQL